MGLNYNHEVKIKHDVIKQLYGNRSDFAEIETCFRTLSVPVKVFIFKVTWEDDAGIMQINTGYRVQHSAALGPYKGGLRFNQNVTFDTFKSLAFEQTFKNLITWLPMGGAKGGSDFDPRGKSDGEIRRFCYAFTDQLYQHIGPDVDVPAGDIGVGMTEIGYIFGRYKQLTARHDGALTGKNVYGSLLRPEATGYGLIYFVMNNMKYLNARHLTELSNRYEKNYDLTGKKILISGSGNVAIHAVKKALQLNAKVLTVSDITGVVYAPNGISRELFDILYDMYLGRKLLSSFKKYDEYEAMFIKMDVLSTGHNLWNQLDQVLDNEAADHFAVKHNKHIDIALTCATQHEIDANSMQTLINRGVVMVAEGSNFGLQDEAVQLCRAKKISYIPGKLSNSGGVMVSQFEMQQNATKQSWTENEVDAKLAEYIADAYSRCRDKADEMDVDFDMAVFAVGFERVRDAMNKLGYCYHIKSTL